MTIRSGPIPPDALNEIRAGIGRMRGLPYAEISGIETAGTDLEPGLPHETFHLGLDDLRAGRGVSAARAVGWRYLLGGRAAQPAQAVEVLRGDDRFQFSGLNEGPFVRQTFDVIRGANAEGDFEARLLRVPAVYVIAVWLASDTGNDVFIPLAPSHPALEPGRMYSREEFELALTRAADEMAAVRRGTGEYGPSVP